MTGRGSQDVGRAGDDGARRALVRRRRRRRIRMGIAWTLVVGAALGIGMAAALGWSAGTTWLRTKTRLLEVRQVDVAPTHWVPPWEAVELAGVGVGDDILALSPDSVRARLERHPRVAHARVKRTWRRTVRLELEERPPVAVWLERDLCEVAADGTVLGAAPRAGLPGWPLTGSGGREPRGVDLPILSGLPVKTPDAGGVLDEEGPRQALAFLALLRTYDRGGEDWISEVWAAEPDGLVMVTLGGVRVRIGDGRLSRRKVEALLAVLDRVRREGEQVLYVDARFRNQVVIKRG